MRLRARTFGVAALLASVAVATLGVEPWRWPLAVALLVVGAFTVLVLWEPVVPRFGAEAALAGSHGSLVSALDALQLRGASTVVPRTGGGELVFVAASPATGKSPPRRLEAPGLLAEDPDQPLGLALEPPGKALLDAYEEEADVEVAGASLPEAVEHLRGLGRATGLFAGLDVTRKAARFEARFTPHATTPCGGPGCERVGCGACSSVVTGLVRALRHPLHVESVVRDGGEVRITLGARGTPTTSGSAGDAEGEEAGAGTVKSNVTEAKRSWRRSPSER